MDLEASYLMQENLLLGWVLGKFKPAERNPILESFYKFNNIIELLSNNEIQNAQLQLHTE